MEIEDLKHKFPKLYEELQEEPEIQIDQVEETENTCPASENKKEPIKRETKMPTVKDHLTGCSKAEEAREIIDYFHKKGEITNHKADKLKNQLKNKGLRSFGDKRRKGEYEKNGI
ncbi:DUF2095 family protein [Methanonatronarchaeum sp. AMET6-2]|uniref:DUF2095 family protein n=1 Tax=Methanonatronarchaeum sp. AMET6-2 TaxID=2933293 RepID=UPI001FF6873E|nr:DUF2095 family protein [Methanonatronarchaeum sp. AMET6-2]UOY09534.1 DUF2095 domain-containing protein [Methanonatronarchaeum sp. AMET6-2]